MDAFRAAEILAASRPSAEAQIDNVHHSPRRFFAAPAGPSESEKQLCVFEYARLDLPPGLRHMLEG